MALKIRPAFDRLFFGDVEDANTAALLERIPAGDRARSVVVTGDCHAIAEEVVAQLPAQALALAFVDPEGFEVTFRMFETLARRKIDILYLFPGGIGVARNVGNFVKQARAPLDDLIPGWRDLKRARLAAGAKLTHDEMAARDQPFVLAFLERMRGLGFQFSDHGEPYFTNDKNVKMYHLFILFTTRGRAHDLAKSHTSRGQWAATPLLVVPSAPRTAGRPGSLPCRRGLPPTPGTPP